MHKPMPTPNARIRRARKIAVDALAHVDVIKDNEALARSTRTRAIYKAKADAMDLMLATLNGKVTA